MGDKRSFKKLNTLAINETIQELEDVRKELQENLILMEQLEQRGRSSFEFRSSSIIKREKDTIKVRFMDVRSKESVESDRNVNIREDDIVWFLEESYDEFDSPIKVKGIVVEAKRLECVIEFSPKGKNEESILSEAGFLIKEFNKESIKSQLLRIESLISIVKSKKIPPGAIPYIFRLRDVQIVELGEIHQWQTDTFKFNVPDPSEEKAVRQSLKGPGITLIQGPPGTGKTSVIAEIALQLLLNNRTVLITSQTNTALDNIVGRIVKSDPNVNLMRIASTPQIIEDIELRKYVSESLITEVRSNSTEYAENDRKMRDLNEKLREGKLLKKLENGCHSKELERQYREAFGNLDFKNEKVVYMLHKIFKINHQSIWQEKERIQENLKDLEESFLKSVIRNLFKSPSIIAATCVGLYSNRISKPLIDQVNSNYLSIGSVILDEASKASRSESIIPLAFSEKAVIVGDERQLPPYMEFRGTGQDNREPESLFDNLIRLPWFLDGKTLLNSNYRSHPKIANLISEIFYGNSLKSTRPKSFNLNEVEEKAIIDLFGTHLLFISHDFKESLEKGSNGQYIKGGYQNLREAEIIEELVRRLPDHKMIKEKVAIIAPYKSQARLMRRKIGNILNIPPDIEIDTVDSFQGMEKPIVLVSLTRSNDSGFIGFVNDIRRMNVMFSRAEDFLIVVGNPSTFLKPSHKDNTYEPLLNEKFSQTFERIFEYFERFGRIISDFDTVFPSSFK